MSQELQNAIDNPDYLVVSGSRLYGTDRPDSDWDYRGFTIPPFDYLIGLQNFEMGSGKGEDHKVFSLKRFFDLVSMGDPQMTETLFTPDEKIIKINEIGRRVRNNRSLFISNLIYKRIMGYGYSEWRKAMGERLIIEKRSKSLDDIIASVRNTKILDKEEMDQFVEWMQKNLERKIVPSKKKLGAKRKAEFEKYGYGVSSAAHAIRLCCQLTELMETKRLTFPRPEADILRAIRSGEIDKVEVEKIHNDKVKLAEKARDNSVLPDRPNRKKILNLYRELVIPKIAVESKREMKGLGF